MPTPVTRLVEGLLRGIELRKALEGRQAEDREAQLAERRQAEVERRNRAAEARQSLLDLVGQQEKVRSLRDKLEAEGAIRLPAGEVPNIERLIEEGGGEGDFSIELGPGVAMAASGGRLESVGDDSFLAPPRALAERGKAEAEFERKMQELRFTGKQQTATALDRMRQEAAVKQELAPVDTIGGLTDIEGGGVAVVERDPRTGTLTPRQVPGLKKKTAEDKLSPEQTRLRENDARVREQEAEANKLLTKYRTPEAAIEALPREAKKNETLRANQLQVFKLLRGFRDRQTGDDSDAQLLRSLGIEIPGLPGAEAAPEGVDAAQPQNARGVRGARVGPLPGAALSELGRLARRRAGRAGDVRARGSARPGRLDARPVQAGFFRLAHDGSGAQAGVRRDLRVGHRDDPRRGPQGQLGHDRAGQGAGREALPGAPRRPQGRPGGRFDRPGADEGEIPCQLRH